MFFTTRLIRIKAQISPNKRPSSETNTMWGGIRMVSTRRTAKIPIYNEMCSLDNQRSKSGSKTRATVRSIFVNSSKATEVVLIIAQTYSISQVKTQDPTAITPLLNNNNFSLGWIRSISHPLLSRPWLIHARLSLPTAQVLLIRLCSLTNKCRILTSAAFKRRNSQTCPNLSTTTSKSWIIAKWILVSLSKRATNTS